jgi:hypothetical protein
MSVYTTSRLKFNIVQIEGLKYYSGEQIKMNEMGEARGTYGRPERCIEGFGGET